MFHVRAMTLWFALLFMGRASASVTAEETNVWWSLRPIVRPSVPGEFGAEHPVDAFLLEKLREKGLAMSPEADRRTLIRRLTFDLIGLPPTPQEVAAFETDTHPRAYEMLVDRLLASPQYGERWARHWLDVVHYGDTHGYDKDQPRPNAWPYRDYVIRSFNEDKPYARFVQEQIAGDILFPESSDGIEALGFISAGPWDLVGHAEVPETKIDGKIARHLDRDDMVANTMSAFTSFTVHCAQCHQHKFDPISTEDYYGLQAVFAALDRTNREYDRDPELKRKRAALKAAESELSRRKAELESELAKASGLEYAKLQTEIAEAAKAGNKRSPQFGYHSAIEANQDVRKWVQVDLGKTESITRITLAAASDDFAGIGDGFGFPPRFKIEVSDDPDFVSASLAHDQTGADLPNPGVAPQSYNVNATGRYVRVTATKLAPRSNDYIFALAELEVWIADGRNAARGATVSSPDSIEAPPRWARNNLVDGIFPSSTPVNIDAVRARLAQIVERTVPPDLRERWHTTTNELATTQHALAALPKPDVAFIGGVHHGSGAFRGTGPDGGHPREIAVLSRGDVRKPRKPAVPGALSAIPALPARFDLADGAPEGERRRALALWLTDRENPLTWRSIVNRVWQYHFGRAIVGTPNDFGRMGELPTHPELLEWLAVEFRDGGQSLKALHKLIVTSAAYRQTSAILPQQRDAVAMDQDNRLLWRMNRRKLEAEAIRDSVLFVSGKLQQAMFGPGFRDFVIEKPEHSPHYQYHLHDPDDAATHRRSIYRFIVRSQQQPFMTTLDCADPSMQVDKRNESISALQALALLNNGFMVSMAGHFATTVERQLGAASRNDALPEAALEARVRRAFSLALSRAPTESELRDLTDFAQAHGLANTCRLLFNLNEFAFVD